MLVDVLVDEAQEHAAAAILLPSLEDSDRVALRLPEDDLLQRGYDAVAAHARNYCELLQYLPLLAYLRLDS